MDNTALRSLAVDTDTQLAYLYAEIADLARRLSDLNARLQPGKRFTFGDAQRREMEQRRDRTVDTLAALHDRAGALEAVHDEHRWTRYFLVTNANGHVHKDLRCSTCTPTTTYRWLVDLAAQPEAEMIAEWGERACTVCFPEAPVDPNYSRPARVDREAAAARATEKATREAAKASKAITAPDGSELRIGYNVLRTKVAARNALSSAIESLVLGYTHEDYPGQVRTLAAALDAAGVDWRSGAARKVKATLKEVTGPLPANLAAFVTPEQHAASQAKIQAGAETARRLLAELGQPAS